MAGVGGGPPSVTSSLRHLHLRCRVAAGKAFEEGSHRKPLCFSKGLCSQLLGDISSESFLQKMSSGSAHSPALFYPEKSILGRVLHEEQIRFLL